AASDLRTAAPAGGSTLSVRALLRLAPERQHNLLRYWVRLRGFAAPPAQLLLRLAKMIEAPTRSHHAALSWPGAEVRRYRDDLWIMKPLTDPDPSLSLPWDPGRPLKVPGTGYVMRTEEAVGNGLAHTRIATRALSVRLRRGGESCRLPGREHHHKLKKLLQDAGIPPWERQRLPLVFVDDVLAAIGDRWVCEPFAARAGETALRVVLEHREKRD
ncbi:MAG: tRNA lysidine(34) synthetase TilS, partial [Acidiferrobacterales bacterium]